MQTKSLTILALLLFPLLCTSQTAVWKNMHKGNRAFENKDYSKAELNYLNALKAQPNLPEARFNLGNVQFGKGNAKAAFEAFEQVKQVSTDTTLRAMTLHNQGYIYHATAMASTSEEERQKALRTAIDYYKQSLRLNPADNNTRYNLALCQKLLKDSQQQEQQQEQNQEQQQQSESQEQQQQQQAEETKRDEKQTQQLLNLAKQAEKRAKEKVDNALKNRRPKNLEKNW